MNKQGGTMKPTEQEIKKAAIDFLEGKPYPIEVITSNQRVIYNFTEGANWAISQMKQEWAEINNEADLPKEQDLYFVTMKKDNKVLTAYFNHQTHTHTWLSAISHWMPIVKPQAPTK